MSHDRFEHSDAAYVLGALGPADRQEFEEHLRECPTCSRAVAELAGLPGLLSRVDASAFDEPERLPVPETLLPSLLRTVRHDRRRRRFGVGLAAAAAAVVVGGVGAAAVDHETSSAPPVTTSASHRLTEVAGQGGPLQANLSVSDVAWGTRLKLTCEYHVDGPSAWSESTPYTLVVHTRDGRSERVASWRVVPNKPLVVVGASASKASDITAVDVRTATGRPVLRFAS